MVLKFSDICFADSYMVNIDLSGLLKGKYNNSTIYEKKIYNYTRATCLGRLLYDSEGKTHGLCEYDGSRNEAYNSGPVVSLNSEIYVNRGYRLVQVMRLHGFMDGQCTIGDICQKDVLHKVFDLSEISHILKTLRKIYRKLSVMDTYECSLAMVLGLCKSVHMTFGFMHNKTIEFDLLHYKREVRLRHLIVHFVDYYDEAICTLTVENVDTTVTKYTMESEPCPGAYRGDTIKYSSADGILLVNRTIVKGNETNTFTVTHNVGNVHNEDVRYHHILINYLTDIIIILNGCFVV